MSGEETPDRGFKVVDKRGRDEEEETSQQAPSQAGEAGAQRGEAERSQQAGEAGAQRAEGERSRTAGAEGERSRTAGELPEIDFSTFVVSLATSALYYLGQVEDPETGQAAEPNLPMARQTIDTLAILQEKTVGNLEAEEEKLLQTLLYDLRMHFVQGTR